MGRYTQRLALVSITGHRDLTELASPSPLRTTGEGQPTARGRTTRCASHQLEREGLCWAEGKLSFNQLASVPSLLLIAAVPRQLLLVEVDDHLGIPGAGFTGRQQGHIFGVLPVARSKQERDGDGFSRLVNDGCYKTH